MILLTAKNQKVKHTCKHLSKEIVYLCRRTFLLEVVKRTEAQILSTTFETRFIFISLQRSKNREGTFSLHFQCFGICGKTVF